MGQIALATEDEVSEAVGLRLVSEMGSKFDVSLRLRKSGSGYLRSRLSSFCQIARRQPVLLITDLDRQPCAASLIAEWLHNLHRHDGLLFRVAVREMKSWLLADHEAVRHLFGPRIARLPDAPDVLPDPKRTLLELARLAPRQVRAELRAEAGAIAAQGLGYNRILGDWVHRVWSPVCAASRSDSLHRARRRLRQFASSDRR